MREFTIPLVVRGEIIEENLVAFPTRRGELVFKSPNVTKYLSKIVLADPVELQDLYSLKTDDIVDYLVELGGRLALDKNPHLRKALEMSIYCSGHSAEIMRHTYEVMPLMLRRENLEEIVEQNIGKRFLDGWVETRLRDRTQMVRAYGARMVHINAGNGAVIALHSLISNALTRSDAIVKIPSNDPFTATAIALTMIEMAPSHPVTKHFTAAYWKGGDEAFEKSLYRVTNIDKIIAWGGFSSMQHIRHLLAPGLDLIALDPKLSCSIVGGQAFASEAEMRKAAELAAMDVGYFNQEGCLNSRTLYIETGTDAAGIGNANRFGEFLFDAIQKLPGRYSSPHPSFDPHLREEIDGLRYSDTFRVIGGKTNEGAVIVSQQDELVDFSERLGCRVANVVPVDNLDAAVHYVTTYTQTIGVYPDSLKEKLREPCALRGGQILVSLGHATSQGMVGPHDAMEQMRRMVRWIVDETIHDGALAGTLYG